MIGAASFLERDGGFGHPPDSFPATDERWATTVVGRGKQFTDGRRVAPAEDGLRRGERRHR